NPRLEYKKYLDVATMKISMKKTLHPPSIEITNQPAVETTNPPLLKSTAELLTHPLL
ncbi:12740_t:CDS:1, partial [Racocetra persica]